MRQWVGRRGATTILTIAVSVTWQAAIVCAGTVPPPVIDPLAQASEQTASAAIELETTAHGWVSTSPLTSGSSIAAVPVRSADITGPIDPARQPLIPLPGAAWTGFAGLFALGAVKVLRNARRLLT